MIEPAAIRPATDQEMWVVSDEEQPGHRVDDQGQGVLGAVEALEVVVDEDGQQGDEDDPLGGAEVAAVDAGEEDPGQQGGTAVGGARPAPARAGRCIRGWTAMSTTASSDEGRDGRLEHAVGQGQEQDGPGQRRRPATPTPSWTSRCRWPASSRR